MRICPKCTARISENEHVDYCGINECPETEKRFPTAHQQAEFELAARIYATSQHGCVPRRRSS